MKKIIIYLPCFGYAVGHTNLCCSAFHEIIGLLASKLIRNVITHEDSDYNKMLLVREYI